MKKLTNIISDKADIVFNLTGFNYDISTENNNDGTINLNFDSKGDADKFEQLYNGVYVASLYNNCISIAKGLEA